MRLFRLFLKHDVKKKKNREFLFHCFYIVKLVTHHQSSEHNWANISETICSVMLVMASWPLGCCSFQNILTNPIISQTDTLLPPYIISYYSSAFTIISTTTTPKRTLRFLTCHCTTACSAVYSKSVLLEWTYLQLIVTRTRQSLDYSARMKELVPCREFSI